MESETCEGQPWEDRIYAKSCEDMSELPDGVVDFAFADLPFNIDIGKRTQARAYGFDGKEYRDSKSRQRYTHMLADWFDETWRTLKPEGSMVVFSGWNYLYEVQEAAWMSAGYHQQGHCIIKYPFGVYTKKRYVSSHYHVLWWTKHKSKWTFNKTKDYMEDVWERKREFLAKKLAHPCPTTSAWIEDFVKVHSNPGDLVLDFNMGVGGTAIACLENDRHYVGYEIDEDYVETAERRITQWWKAAVLSKAREMPRVRRGECLGVREHQDDGDADSVHGV